GSTAPTGAVKDVKFSGALQLTHNATSFILPAGANINTVAGDCLRAVHEGSGNWRITAYERASGTALVASGTIGGSTGSTDNAALRADGTGGATLQSSAFIIDDSGHVS